MAFPASFAESNRALGRPRDMSDEQCEPLCIADGVMPDGCPVVVSCWKLTAEELGEVNRTGRIWVMVPGNTMQPMTLIGCKSALWGSA